MKIVLALGVCLALATQAEADAILEITSGATTVSVTDTDGDGVVSFMGAVGVFNLQVTVGTTKPLLGTAASPQMDLFNVSVSSVSGGMLTIAFTDDDFLASTRPQMGVYMGIGGTTDGIVSTSVKADDNNAPFGGSTVATLGPYGPGVFSATGTGALVGFTGTYSLTLGATIVHTGGQQVSSFDFVTTVPEPATLALLGSAVSMVCLWRRRRS